MNFFKLEPKDYSKLKPFFINQSNRLCVYSLSCIIAWSNKEFQPYGAVCDDSLIVYANYTEQKKDKHLILPISPVREYFPKDIYNLAKNVGIDLFWCVPEDYLLKHGRDNVEIYFNIEEQKGFDDYIYLTEDLANLKGNKYSKKRNLIHQFRKEHIEKDVVIEAIKFLNISECIDFLEEWCDDAKCDFDEDKDLACEKQAAKTTLENIENFEVNGLLMRIEGKISAFGIASKLTKDIGVLHFEKALSSVKGLYQFFDSECAKRLFKDFKYINKESNMNIKGLEKSKRSYYPAMMIKSYQLTVKS